MFYLSYAFQIAQMNRLMGHKLINVSRMFHHHGWAHKWKLPARPAWVGAVSRIGNRTIWLIIIIIIIIISIIIVRDCTGALLVMVLSSVRPPHPWWPFGQLYYYFWKTKAWHVKRIRFSSTALALTKQLDKRMDEEKVEAEALCPEKEWSCVVDDGILDGWWRWNADERVCMATRKDTDSICNELIWFACGCPGTL